MIYKVKSTIINGIEVQSYLGADSENAVRLRFDGTRAKISSIEPVKSDEEHYKTINSYVFYSEFGAYRFRSNEYGQLNLKFIGFTDNEEVLTSLNLLTLAMVWLQYDKDMKPVGYILTEVYYNRELSNKIFDIGRFAAKPIYQFEGREKRQIYCSRTDVEKLFTPNEKVLAEMQTICQNSYIEHYVLQNPQIATEMLDKCLQSFELNFKLLSDFKPRTYRGKPVTPKRLMWAAECNDEVPCKILIYHNYKDLHFRASKNPFKNAQGWHCEIHSL